MRIEVVSPFELASVDLRRWAGFQAASADLASPFLSPGWSMALAKADGPDRRHGRVAVLVDAGEAVGFCAARVGRFTAMPAGALMSDYQAVVSEPGLAFDPRDLVRALGVQRLDLANVPESQTALAPFLRGRTESRVIDISQGFDAYARARKEAGAGVLQDAAKKRRKLEREHGEVVFTALSASRADLAQLLAWKSAQYAATGQADILEAGWTRRLIEHLHGHEEPGCAGALFTLHAGGKLAAAHYALRAPGVLHGWFIAHDDEVFGRYSPGVMLMADMLRWGSDHGVRELDLGPGDYRFKLQFANCGRTLGHGFVARPSPAALVREAQYRVRSAAEALPLGRYSELPAKAMRRLDKWRGLR